MELEENNNIGNVSPDERDYVAALARIRTLEGVYQEIENLRSEGGSFGHPSYFKYSICGGLALLKDGLDIISLLGIYTIPVWWLIGPVLSVIVLIIFWFFNVKQKNAKDYMKNLEQNIEVVQENIIHAIRVASKVPGIKKRVAKFGVAKITKFLTCNPTVKIAIGTGSEAVPLWNLVPWNVLAVVLAYIDERKIYKNAAQNGEEAYSQLISQLNETV